MSGNPLIGTVIDGRYKILEPIAEGGMGAVYKAEHTALRKLVAFKVLHREFLGERDFELRFQREAQATSRLSHPNVVAVTDFGHTDRLAYLVMEYLHGRPLDVEPLPLVPARAVSLMRQVLAGLAHAHAAGVIHRDLKPANVMLVEVPADAVTPLAVSGAPPPALAGDAPGGRRGDEPLIEVAKILDFGVAKLLDPTRADPTLTQVGLVVGTPRYMSPEQALAQQNIDHRTDIYAAGVVLYELCTGVPPFMDDSAARLLRAHALQEPEPPRKKVPGLSPALERAILRALEKRPEDRFASAQEFQEALAAVPEGLPRPQSGFYAPASSGVGMAATMAAGPGSGLLQPKVGPAARGEEIIELLPRHAKVTAPEPAWASGEVLDARRHPTGAFRPRRRRGIGAPLVVLLLLAGLAGAAVLVVGPSRVRTYLSGLGTRLTKPALGDGGPQAPRPSPKVVTPVVPEVITGEPEPAHERRGRGKRPGRGTAKRRGPAGHGPAAEGPLHGPVHAPPKGGSARPSTGAGSGAATGAAATAADAGAGGKRLSGRGPDAAAAAAASEPADSVAPLLGPTLPPGDAGAGRRADAGRRPSEEGPTIPGNDQSGRPTRKPIGPDAAGGPGGGEGPKLSPSPDGGSAAKRRSDRYEAADDDDDGDAEGLPPGGTAVGGGNGSGPSVSGVARPGSKVRRPTKRKRRKGALRKKRRPRKRAAPASR